MVANAIVSSYTEDCIRPTESAISVEMSLSGKYQLLTLKQRPTDRQSINDLWP